MSLYNWANDSSVKEKPYWLELKHTLPSNGETTVLSVDSEYKLLKLITT